MPKRSAKASSIGASLGVRTDLTFTSKAAALPARFSAPYFSGNVTFSTRSSPALAPKSCSSNPGINCFEPSISGAPSAAPPSNGTPSILPRKSIVIASPSPAGASVSSNGRLCLASSAKAASTCSSATGVVNRSSEIEAASIGSKSGITSTWKKNARSALPSRTFSMSDSR